MTNLITMKQYNEIKNKCYTMISYNLETMTRAYTTTGDMVSLMEYQMGRPDLGHLVLDNDSYFLIPFDIRYSRNAEDMKMMIKIAFNNRKL